MSVYSAENNFQPKNSSELYENYTLKYYYNFWKGSGYTRGIDNKLFRVNGFGADKDFMDLLFSSPSAKSFAADYKKQNLAGNIFYWAGLAVMLSSIFYGGTPGMNQQDINVIRASMIGAAVVSMFAGLGFMISANTSLQAAIWNYNKDVISGQSRLVKTNSVDLHLAFNKQF